MRLADFIRAHRKPILAEWEAFARTCAPASDTMDVIALRDHADQMLTVIATDLDTPQDRFEQSEKGQGRAQADDPDAVTAAQHHGAGRVESGFDVQQMVAEYRALRASVIRLWARERGELVAANIEDLTRFNEAIDQLLAESITEYDQGVEQSNEAFLAIIEHREHAERQLRENEGRLQQILDTLPVGVILADASGQFVWHNPAALRIWGGLPLVGPDRYAEYRGWWAETGQRIQGEAWALARALCGEEVSGKVVDIEAFDGARRTALISAAPLRDNAGAVVGAVTVQEDVTESRARDAKQRLLAAALGGLHEGVCLLTPEGEIVYANETFTRMLGVDPGRVPGLRMDAFAPDPEAAVQQQDNFRTASQQGHWSGRILRKRLSDGVAIPMDVILGRLDEGGPGAGLLYGVVQEATETIQREQQLRRAERLASLGTLIGGVAHELNNPLHAIYNFSELMLMEERTERDRESLEIIRRESERMAKIVSDLKELARNTQAEAQTRTAVDLNEVVRHVLKVQGYRLKTSNIEVFEDLAEELPTVLGDRGALEQVVLNLIINAEQAMASHAGKGRLILRTRASAKGAALHVVDSGPGIPANQLERIWDPFYTTRSEGEGTGLGLSLVHSIIAEHGGEIHVDSQVGSGAAFRLDLSRAPEAPQEAMPARLEQALTRSLRILVVDDEASVRTVTVRLLERRGHQVDQASEGTAALEMLEEAAYDVILSDLRMPGLGGEAMMERLQERGLSHKVMFLTGDSGGGVGARMERAGVPVLLKPISLEELVRAVEGIGGRVDAPDR